MNIYKESAKVRGFYDTALWKETDPKPKYFNLFLWKKGDTQFWGELNENKFNTLKKKIYYLKGIIEHNTEMGWENTKIGFANSRNMVYRCEKWFNEVKGEFKLKGNIKVVIGAGPLNIPECNEIHISQTIVEFIKNYK